MERRELTVKFTTNGKDRHYTGIVNPMSENIVKKTIRAGERVDFLYWRIHALLNNWDKI